MAHPLKKETNASHSAKLKAMTTDYGAANANMGQLAMVDKYKPDGPEDSIGYGADSDRPRLHGARQSRMTSPANPYATYAKGGRVKKYAGGGKVPGEPSPSAEQPAQSSEPSPTPVDNRARGGRTRKKGGTHVNIMIAPQHPPAGPPLGLPLGGNPAIPPMMPPPRPPVGGPPPPMGGPGPGAGLMPPPAAMAPGGIPPGLIPPRKHGGRVMKHSDEAEDAAQIKSMVRKSALKPHGSMRAAGGRIGLTAGAYSGEGRLEKAAAHAKDRKKPQEV